MNRRRFIQVSALGATALRVTSSTALARPAKGHFSIALAGLPRHHEPDELAGDLKRYRQRGYTGIWIENDYLRWTWDRDPDQGFGGNWRLLNLFDFTLSRERDRYVAYLRRLDQLCAREGLDIYASFWLPKLNAELADYLTQKAPTAVGKVIHEGEPRSTFCTCAGGPGLALLRQSLEQFLRSFPRVRGLKVSTEDNACYICDETCPNASGATQAQNAANLFETVQQSMLRFRPDAQLLLYPWFWKPGWEAQILGRLRPGYLVVTKMEAGSRQPIEGEGEPLFDSSIVSGKPGPLFLEWVRRAGPERIIDMVPVGTGIDDFFLPAPPYPGRLYRRFKTLKAHGVRRLLDFECGGHQPGANEETVAVFNQDPELSETACLAAVAQRMYRRKPARAAAIRGWQAFDLGFGCLPIGLADTGCPGYSGRIGFGWSLCVATPMVRAAFGAKDQGHSRHWFSPYNFFNSTLASRLELHFAQTLTQWETASQELAQADAIEGGTTASQREALVAIHPLTGLLYVCDAGPNQCVWIFDAQGRPAGRFGELGGVYQNKVAGRVDAAHLYFPRAITFDDTGCLYLAMAPRMGWTGGALLRKYDPTGKKIVWERQGLEFQEAADGDPGTDGVEVFTQTHRYTMDFSKGPGQEAVYSALTFDPFTYPADKRNTSNGGGVNATTVRRIDGQRILFLHDWPRNGWNLYRFKEGSEIAIPCGKATNGGLWIDKNGDGSSDPSDEVGPKLAFGQCWTVDAHGDIWSSGGKAIRCWRNQGLNEHGVPIYTPEPTETYEAPAPFIEASHAIYDAALDRLFVGGFNTEHPKDRTDHGGSVGSMLCGFGNVRASKGLGQRLWQRELPYEAGGVGLGNEVNNLFCASYAGDAQGGYLFIGGLSERGVRKISIWALDPKPGAMVQRFLPGPEVAGYCGWFDFNNAINAMKRKDGEYILFAEDDGAQKVNIFRWRPAAGQRE